MARANVIAIDAQTGSIWAEGGLLREAQAPQLGRTY